MTESFNEKSVLKSVSQGDRNAFRILYTYYLHDIFRYLFLYTKNRETCEEIVQNVFLKIWEHRENVVEIASFRYYLYRCAKNLLTDETRKNERRKVAYMVMSEKSEISSEKSDDKLIVDQYSRIALKAITFLPKKRKEIIKLHTLENCSYDEIAIRLSISKSVVKKQVYAGILFIRNYFKKHAEIEL